MARALTRPLAAFLLLVAVALAVGVAGRLAPRTAAAVVQRLVDADVEGHERRADLAWLQAAAAGGAEPRLWAAMAALALGDAAAWERALSGRELPFDAAHPCATDPAARRRAALGDPLLAALLDAMAREVGGDRAGAVRGYGQVEQSSKLFHQPLVGQVAVRGRARLGG